MIGGIALFWVGAGGGIAGAAGPGDGYIKEFYAQSPAPNTTFAVANLSLPAGKFMVSMIGEGVAGTSATASLSCSFSPASKGYVPYGVQLDGLGKTIGAVAGVDLPSGGTVTLSCRGSQPEGKFVILRGALSAVHVASLSG